MLTKIKNFINENSDQNEKKINTYRRLNGIGVSHKKFPYNLFEVHVTPTYETINLLYKEPMYKTGGFIKLDEILVFYY